MSYPDEEMVEMESPSFPKSPHDGSLKTHGGKQVGGVLSLHCMVRIFGLDISNEMQWSSWACLVPVLRVMS